MTKKKQIAKNNPIKKTEKEKKKHVDTNDSKAPYLVWNRKDIFYNYVDSSRYLK